MPRRSTDEDDQPRRRRARAVAAEPERGLLLRVLLHSPKDTVAGLLAVASVSAIVINALLLQTGRHPAPMFGTVVKLPAPSALPLASPLPRPRPPQADALPLEPRPMDYRPAEPKPERPPGPRASEPRAADPIATLVRATTSAPAATSSIALRPPAPIPVTHPPAARRIAAVQRALAEYGYGQVKPTGTVGPDTQVAIARFEREHRLPVTGQVSDRFIRELTVVIGHPLD